MIMRNFYHRQINDILVVTPTGEVRLKITEELSP